MEHHDCIFCKIVNKEIPCKVVAENELALAFMDIQPASDGHCLVIPKKHFIDLEHTDEQYLIGMIKLTKEVASILSYDKELDPWGFNYLSNQGDIAGQIVKHTHLHIIPKYAKDQGFSFSSNTQNLQPIDEVYKSIIETKNKYFK